jgi:hypothetical protein
LLAPQVLALVALTIAGCAQMGTAPVTAPPEPVARPTAPPLPANAEPPPAAVNLSGFPLPYRQGYADGCASATGAERKDAGLVATIVWRFGSVLPAKKAEVEARVAHRQVGLAEAEQMLVTGIPFRTPSRFGWPGRLLRTAVLRLIRPYAHFEVRAHQQHLHSTMRVVECLRRLDAAISALRGTRPAKTSASVPRLIPLCVAVTSTSPAPT